jgi:hypothetical protein
MKRIYSIGYTKKGETEPQSLPLNIDNSEIIPYDLNELYVLAKDALIKEGIIQTDLTELQDVLVASFLVTEDEFNQKRGPKH